jgi:Undecaprenyl-phosphate glucose phosphotransferase
MAGAGYRELRSPEVVLGLLRFVDAIVVAVAAALAFWARHGHFDAPFVYMVVTLVGVVLMANALHASKLYVFESLMALTSQVHKLSLVLPVVFLMLLALGFFTKTTDQLSRIWLVTWFAFAAAGLIGLRVLLVLHLASWQRRGWLTRNLVIVGAGETGQRLVHHLNAMADPALNILGLFDDRRTRVPAEIGGYGVLGVVDGIVAFVRDNRVDEIIIAMPWTNKPRLVECMDKLKTVPMTVRLCPDTLGFHLYNRSVSHIGGVPMFNLWEPPLSGWSVVVKAAEDRILAILILLLALPTLLTIAALVKLDSPGPVLFRQRRFGFKNDVFTVLKFSSMAVDVDRDGAVPQATRGDLRVTRLGAFLRRHSLDEPPQFLNVIKGDMSIVGPRPHAVAHNEQYAGLIDDYLARHKVKPGITGWAQVNGLRGETDTIEKMETRVQHDLYYVDNWSLLFDLRIILLTLFVGFRSDQAY